MTFLEAIQALGETPEEVSQLLREKGIKGYKCIAGRCPVAQYLNACGFPYVSVAVSANRYANWQPDSRAVERVVLNQGVQSWIRRFDDGQYPEFIKS